MVAIGSVEEFRVPDGEDGGRTDNKEIVTTWSPPGGNYTFAPDHPFVKTILQGQVPPMPVEVTIAEGAKFIFRPNAYLYCTSLEYTDDLKERMALEFGADACIAISRPLVFIEALRQHPLMCGRKSWYRPVEYAAVDAEVTEFKGNNPFLKRLEFSWQKEFRILWSAEPAERRRIIEVSQIIPTLSRLY